MCAAILTSVVSAETDVSSWKLAVPVVHIAGRVDVVVAATPGGLVAWARPVGPVRVFTTAHGLASNDIRDVCFDALTDRLVVATSNGLARGWLEGGWQKALSGDDGSGREDASGLTGHQFHCLFAVPEGGVLAGSDAGLLVRWQGARIDSLRVPTRSRVVAITHSNLVAQKPATKGAPVGAQTAPAFQLGLVAATERDGLWILRQAWPVRWLRIGEMDGLPSREILAVLTDEYGALWAATRAGLARLSLDADTGTIRLSAWPQDPLLTQRATSLLSAPNRRVYFGYWGGLAYFDPNVMQPVVETLPGVDEGIAGIAWSDEGLWWSNGRSLRSFLGVELMLPEGVASARVCAIAAIGDEIWMGDDGGGVSIARRSGEDRGQHATGVFHGSVRNLFAFGEHTYAGPNRGLHVALRLGTGVQFQPVEAAPEGEVRAQVAWKGHHWIGGSMGLWERRDSGWWPHHLWSGASEIQSMVATAETLWATAGEGGVAFHDGTAWTVTAETCHFAGPLAVDTRGRVAVGTDTGVMIRDGRRCEVVETLGGIPRSIAFWGSSLVVGGESGVWLVEDSGRSQRGSGWRMSRLSADVRDVWSLAVDPLNHLWVGTGCGVYRLKRANRSRIEVASRGQSAAALFEIFDVRGRRVCSLRLQPDALSRFSWDGSDQAGRPVASGVYFARARAGRTAESLSWRIVVGR